MEVQSEPSSSPIVVDCPEPIYTVTLTGKYCCRYLVKYSLVTIAK